MATTPKAAPAVIRPIEKAKPQERPARSTRPTPLLDPPAKRQKPVTVDIPQVQKGGKGKSKSRPGSGDEWRKPPQVQKGGKGKLPVTPMGTLTLGSGTI